VADVKGYPTLKAGMRNKAVLAMQNGLHRALAAKKLPHKNLRNGAFGSLTVEDVGRFKRTYDRKGAVDRKTFGSLAWNQLEPYLGAYDRTLIRQYKEALAARIEAARKAAEEAKSAGARRARVGQVALRFYRERYRYRYAQVRPYSKALFSGGRYYDCSSSNTVQYYVAECPDPNGRGFDGYGFTGTLWPRGSATSSPRVGDLAFYGWSSTFPGMPSHVAVVVPTPSGSSGTWVVSFGSNPVKLLPLRYRSDFRGCRSYL
jgi:hypothetical protein